jgi:hypothetical protein
MSAELIDRNYGNDLDAIERSVAAIIPQYFLDDDGFPYACLNGATNRPYVDTDPELDYPLEKTWWYNGSFPYELKRTFFNYEDSDMVAGELLQVYVARARVAPTPENVAAADNFADLMLQVSERIGRENPYGYGFLPKLHGGIKHLHEDFEFSADQLLKWMSALDAYRDFTTDAGHRQRIDDLFLACARWFDARDFAVSYMGNMGWIRLTDMRHYLTTMAYVCARGYEISGDRHLQDETNFFRDRVLFASKDSPSANTVNLVVEALTHLIRLQPEATEAWLAIARRNWHHRTTYYRPEGTPRYGLLWNESHNMALNYLLTRRLLPEIEGDLDPVAILLAHNCKRAFYHLVQPPEIPPDFDDHGMGLRMYVNIVLGQAYATWLRVYWLLKGEQQ